jgi:hypothetical protein
MATSAEKKAAHVASIEATKKTLSERITQARTALHERFANAFDDASQAFSPENMRAQITEMLGKERKEIVYRLLGLRSDWGRVELDNNSRNPGLLHGYMDTAIKQEVERWLDEEIRPALLNRAGHLTNDPKFKAGLLKDFQDRFSWKIRDYAMNEADRIAREAAETYAKELRAELSMVADK